MSHYGVRPSGRVDSIDGGASMDVKRIQKIALVAEQLSGVIGSPELVSSLGVALGRHAWTLSISSSRKKAERLNPLGWSELVGFLVTIGGELTYRSTTDKFKLDNSNVQKAILTSKITINLQN